MKRLYYSLFVLLLLAGFVDAYAGKIISVNASSFLHGEQTALKNKSADKILGGNLEYSTYQADVKALSGVMNNAGDLRITNFPITQDQKGTLVLKRKKSVVDQNSKFYIAGATADIPMKTPTVDYFEGQIENYFDSKVALVCVNGTVFAKMEHSNNSFVFAPYVHSKESNVYAIIDENSFYKNYPVSGLNCIADSYQKALEKDYKNQPVLLSNQLLEVELALETDTEFYKATGSDINKTSAYIIAVYSFVSRVYEEQVNITVYLKNVKIWTDNPADPYDAQGNPFILESKAPAYWNEHYQNVERDVAQILTSVSYGGGGFGYFNALCNQTTSGYSFASLQGYNSYPTFAFTYDVYTAAHELGHNFNAQHTHSCYWGVPLDTCLVGDAISAGCLEVGTTPKPNPGSIMSYCGAPNNDAGLGFQVRMIFLPQNKTLIRTTAEGASCITEPANPKVKITNPRGPKTFNSGDVINITWTSSHVDNIKLDYSMNNGVTWDPIESSVSAVNGTYAWKTPSICANNVLIRISSTASDLVVDTTVIPVSIIMEDTTGLIAYYPFNNNSNDEQQCHLYNATGVNDPTLTKDKFGIDNSAYRFNGSNYLHNDEFTTDFSQLTVSLWFYGEDFSANNHLIGTNWEENWAYSMYYYGEVGAAYYIDGHNFPVQIWGGSVPKNSWHQAAFTFDGRYAKLYVDGVLKNTNDEGTAAVHKINPWHDAKLYIGSRKDKDPFKGNLDEIKIYKKALNANEIKAVYDSYQPALTKVLLQLPENNATGLDTALTLTWNAVDGSSGYDLQVSETEGTEGIILDKTQITGTSYVVNSLKPEHDYYWRVRAVNQSASGDWSDARRFTTRNSTGVYDYQNAGIFNVQAVPNPANSTLKFGFNLVEAGNYSLSVVNSLGLEVADLFTNHHLEANYYLYNVDLSAEPSGVYFIMLKGSNFVIPYKIQLIK